MKRVSFEWYENLANFLFAQRRLFAFHPQNCFRLNSLIGWKRSNLRSLSHHRRLERSKCRMSALTNSQWRGYSLHIFFFIKNWLKFHQQFIIIANMIWSSFEIREIPTSGPSAAAASSEKVREQPTMSEICDNEKYRLPIANNKVAARTKKSLGISSAERI